MVINPQVTTDSARTNIVDNYVLEGSGVQNNNLDRLAPLRHQCRHQHLCIRQPRLYLDIDTGYLSYRPTAIAEFQRRLPANNTAGYIIYGTPYSLSDLNLMSSFVSQTTNSHCGLSHIEPVML